MLAIAMAMAGLAGCSLGPDFHRPDPPAADGYTAQPLTLQESATGAEPGQTVTMGGDLSRDWWRLFGSPALDEVVARALTGNRTLEAATLNLAQANEIAAAQAGALAPQVGLTGGVGRQKYGAEFLGSLAKPPPFTYFAVGATVSYALDYTGGVARSVEQQYALADYQRQQVAAAYLAVSGNAVMQALKIASLRAQIAAVDAILEEDRSNLHLVQEAFAAGSVSRLDIVSAQSQLASDATLLPPLRQELSVAQHALAIILGQAPASAALPVFDLGQMTLPRELPVSLPSELAHRRPDILAAEAQLHATTAAVGVATANLYPQINLSATLGQQATELSQIFERTSSVWNLAGALAAPILDGGTRRAQQRAATDAMRASAANYQQTVLAAFGQVADSLQALEHDAQQLDAQAHAKEAAGENLDLTRRSYDEGNVGVLQVLDAQRAYQRALLGYIRAEAQRYTDTAQLFLALGGGIAEADLPSADDTHRARQ